MEDQEITIDTFRQLTKEKRSKGRPRLTEEEKQRRLREKALRLTHINQFAEPNGLKLIRTRIEGRDCFKWEAIDKNLTKKLEGLDRSEIVVYTSRLNLFSFDQWKGDMEKLLKKM